MKKIWVKFLKDYETYKKDQVVELEESTANSLINLKFADKTEVPNTDIIDGAMKGLSDNFKDAISTAVKSAIEETNKQVGDSIKKYLPAIPKDHEAEAKGGFNSFGDFLYSVRGVELEESGTVKEKMKAYGQQIVAKAPLGINTLQDEEGGYLVPEQWSNEIWDYVVEAQEILPRTDQRTTSSNNLNLNGFEELSLKDGYRDSGVRAYWLEEAAEYTASQPKWKKMRMELKKLGVLCYVTEEELSDAKGLNLGPTLQRKAANAINWLVNDSFLNGTGVGKPLGILNADTNATLVIPIETNQAAGTILHRNLIKMYYRMLPGLRKSSVWMVHPNLEELLPLIAFADETSSRFPIYIPPGGLSASPYGSLFGKPVIPSQFCQDVGTPGDIIHVAWSQYMTLQKAGAGIKSATSMHVRFLFDEQVFKFSFRIDGQPSWSHPMEDYKGTTLRSPYIILGDRTSASESTGL